MAHRRGDLGDDDYEDDRSHRRRSQRRSGFPVWAWVAIGVGTFSLLGVGCLGTLIYSAGKVKNAAKQAEEKRTAEKAVGDSGAALDLNDPRTIVPYLKSFQYVTSGNQLRELTQQEQYTAHRARLENVPITWTLVVEAVEGNGCVRFKSANWPYETQREWESARDDDRPFLSLGIAIAGRPTISNDNRYFKVRSVAAGPDGAVTHVSCTCYSPPKDEALKLNPGDKFRVAATLQIVSHSGFRGDAVRTNKGSKESNSYTAVLTDAVFTRVE